MIFLYNFYFYFEFILLYFGFLFILNLLRIALKWTTSWYCVTLGILAVSSAEVSLLILTFMSVERFLLIAHPFRIQRNLSSRSLWTALISIWMLGFALAVMPVIMWRSSTRFYGTYSGTCFPLLVQEAFPLGWQYSAFIFLVVNLVLMTMIVVFYSALLVSICRTRRATPLCVLDCEFAVRFFFIVLTDIICWTPIIIVKIWVFFNYSISGMKSIF